MYAEYLKAIVSWFYPLDHYNYVCFILIHIQDMESLAASILHDLRRMITRLIKKEEEEKELQAHQHLPQCLWQWVNHKLLETSFTGC